MEISLGNKYEIGALFSAASPRQHCARSAAERYAILFPTFFFFANIQQQEKSIIM